MKTYSNSKIVKVVEGQDFTSYKVLEVQGEFWKSPKNVVEQADFPEEFSLRYLMDDGIFESIAFWYRITGKNFSHWGYAWDGSEIVRIKCKIVVPDPENPKPEFGAWLYLEELEV